ncbi:MAG TPA: hypothetical protein VHE80_07960 [Acidimicrobiales bacterium]|nr:hypothetical protein [Acidimicrobiales bacterium]
MPWCDDCNRFWPPAAVEADGECPTCHAVIDLGLPEVGEVEEGAPWHFKLLVVASVVYLAYRAYYGVLWLLGD